MREARNGGSGPGLQPQDLVITMLGTYLRPRSRRLWSGGVVELLGEFGFSPGAARIALVRLVNRELLERTMSGRLAFYTLTGRSHKLLHEGDRRIFSLGERPSAADHWTVVWHAIPEDQRLKRDRLARRLRFLGFGALQDGTWVSPHEREAEAVELIEDLGVQAYCGVLIGSPAEALDFRTFVSRMWPLDELSGRYRAYLDEFKPYARRRSLGDEAAFQVRTRAVHAFRQFPALDPQLPDDYMSAPQFRAEAIEVFTDLYERLAKPASRHFDAATEGPVKAAKKRRTAYAAS
ncbi:MAG: PaaX family transcriptional regulator [Actinobacteria bacterium]|nr:PaaX family transcriptional regulator [Actinomycetota bacterium]